MKTGGPQKGKANGDHSDPQVLFQKAALFESANNVCLFSFAPCQPQGS
jgi:hypothetical protein